MARRRNSTSCEGRWRISNRRGSLPLHETQTRPLADSVGYKPSHKHNCHSERSEAVTQPAERARPGFPSVTISGLLGAALAEQSEILRFTQDNKFCRFMRWLYELCQARSVSSDSLH